jgi:hypothetical protein
VGNKGLLMVLEEIQREENKRLEFKKNYHQMNLSQKLL